MSVVDFVVIGAPNTGTDDLRNLLAAHPKVALPAAPNPQVLINEHRYTFGPEWLGPGFFTNDDDDAVRGAIDPGHMSGLIGLSRMFWSADEVSAAMVRTLPDAKLIALLDEPISRAVAQHRLALSRGLERRPLERALREQSRPAALAAARLHPRVTTTYVAWSEYGRILEAYRKHYARSQLLVLLRSELITEPVSVRARVAEFLGLGEGRYPTSDAVARERPDQELAPLSGELRSELDGLFAADAQRLRDTIAIDVPWAESKAAPVRSKRRRRKPDVSIIVLVHETPAEAELALDSIVRHTSGAYEVVLVDNGSSDLVREALESIAERYRATLLRFDENLNFCAVNNAAVQRSQADEILLLNSDVIVTENWLSNMRAALHSAPDVGLVGPRTTNVQPPQGGIWLDDSSVAGVERFGRFFNHPDPARWFETSHLCAFALLARRAAWDAVGGLNTDFPWYGNDGELSASMLRAGWRLLCAGDTFIHHDGHRSFWLTGSNRTARRLGVDEAEIVHESDSDAVLVKDSKGWVFEVRGGVASHVETYSVVKMIQAGRVITGVSDTELAGMTVGPPICNYRVRGTDEVWVIQSGTRRRVTGDKQRVRRLPELSMVEAGELAALPRAADLAIEDGLPPVSEIRLQLPFNPAVIAPEKLVSADRVANEIADALQREAGYALIRLDDDAALLLNEGIWPTDGRVFDPVGSGAGVDHAAAARAVREAIVDADAVGVTTSTGPFVGAHLIEQLLAHFELYPRLRCSAEINYELFGVDQSSGLVVGRPLLASALGGRPLALVGPATLIGCVDWRRRAQLQQLGIDIRLAVSLDDTQDVPTALAELSVQRDAYDAVLVAAGIPAKPLCARVARDLGAVALDVGRALDQTLYPGYYPLSPGLVAQRYLREYLSDLVAAPPPPHELDGRLVRVPGKAAVYYVERGAARPLPHRELLQLFADPPIEIDRDALASLRQGVPLFVIHERLGATYLVINGTRRSLGLGLALAPQDDATLDLLAIDGRAIHWYPGAGPGLAGRGR